MIRLAAKLLIMSLAIWLTPGIAAAGVITFGTTIIPDLVSAGAQTEGAFRYIALDGGWEVNTLGEPGVYLCTFFDVEFPLLGQVVEITAPGFLFTFDSVDFRTPTDQDADDVLITGLLGGATVGTLALTTSPPTFQTASSPFSGEVDTLRVVVTSLGITHGMALDNFVVNVTREIPSGSVPEPASLAIWGFGAIGMAIAARRRKKQTVD
jgi:PEP-CTERM motif